MSGPAGPMEDPRADGLDRARARQEPPSGSPKLWLSDLSIRQPVFITMLVLAVMVVGTISYSRLGLDLLPDISLPVVVVQTAYPGATPAEVERSVTRPIEDAVASVGGVENVRSASLEGVSQVVVEFRMEKDPKEAADEVRTRVTAIGRSLPADAKEPVILRFDPSSSPILSLAISNPTGQRSPEQLRALVDDVLKPRIERVSGVAAVDVSGGRVREVHVDLGRAKLEAYGLPPQQVIQAIRSEDLDLPAGRVLNGRREESLRTAGGIQSLDQLAEIPVATKPGGVVLRLRDVARVAGGYAEVRTLSRLDGQESVVAEIWKQSGTNTVQVADAVKRELVRLESEHPDLSFAVAVDQSTFTREAVQDVQLSLLLGGLLAALVVLLFFRDLRNTLVTVAGLPVIILGTFAVQQLLGLTLNMMTMLALSLSVGMLIDDAIVVRENIFRHMGKGEEPRIAAGRGTAEIALAVLAVSSTIVGVFLPIAFAEGIAGKILREFGITVAVAVVISLVEALTLAPMLSAYFFRRSDPTHDTRGRADRLGQLLASLNDRYRRLLGWSLRHRLFVVVGGLVAFVGSLALVPQMTVAFMPELDQGRFGVGVELEPGARLAETDRAARDLEQILLRDPDVAHVFTTVGTSDGAAEKATLNVELRERGRTEGVVIRLRPELERALVQATDMEGAKLSASRQAAFANFVGGAATIGAVRGRPIHFNVQGGDFTLLDQVSADLAVRLQQVPGVVDVDRTIKARRPGQAIVPDRARASDLGVTVAQVGTVVRALVNGERVGSFRTGEKDLDVVVRLAEADRDSAAEILRLPLVTTRGTQVPLAAVASLVESPEPDRIDRENRQRQVVVGAGYLGRDLGRVSADAWTVVSATNLPPGVTIRASGQARYTAEMFATLGLALGLAVLFVYMILASQFGSFVHPFTIMLALPFSVVGALLSLFLAGFALDMLGMIGIILLMGLVTKNSILLVEFTNQLRRRGLSTREAILEAGAVRLRPILMTSLAMIFGMLPVAAGLGAGAELRRSMGISVIGGLITSTLLTLVVVPVAYSLIDDLGRLVARRGRQAAAPEVRAGLP